jgi:phosphoenolpyruvate---glycerone phosphotransferase subunit DhaL
VLAAAAAAAAKGAEDTVDLVARKGRASYLGERSAGHLDPGARSTALLLGAFSNNTTAQEAR